MLNIGSLGKYQAALTAQNISRHPNKTLFNLRKLRNLRPISSPKISLIPRRSGILPKHLTGFLQGVDQDVDLLLGVVEAEGDPGGGRDFEELHDRHGAVMAGA